MVKIIYQGPVGNHMVSSPSRLVRTYGMHSRGDIFEVHERDQQAKPAVFVLIPKVEVQAIVPESVVIPDKSEPEVVVVPEQPKQAPVKRGRKKKAN